MEGRISFDGLPRPPSPLQPGPDSRRASHGHPEAPPTPQSAGPAPHPTQHGLNLLHEGMLEGVKEYEAYRQKFEAYKFLVTDRQYHMDQGVRLRAELAAATNNVDLRRQELAQETTLKAAAEARVAELQRENDDLQASCALLHCQVQALEQEKLTLQVEMENERTNWTRKAEEAKAEITQVEQILNDQTRKRFELQQRHDELAHDLQASKGRIWEVEAKNEETDKALRKAEAAVKETQMKLDSSNRKVAKLQIKTNNLDESRQTLEWANTELSDRLSIEQELAVELEKTCKSLELKESAQASEIEALNKTNQDLTLRLKSRNAVIDKLIAKADEAKIQHTTKVRTLERNLDDAVNNNSAKTLKAELDIATSKNALDNAQISLATCKTDLHDLRQLLDRTGRERDTAKERNEELERRAIELWVKVRELEHDKKQLVDQVSVAEHQTLDMGAKVQGLERENKTLKDSNSELENEVKNYDEFFAFAQKNREKRTTPATKAEVRNADGEFDTPSKTALGKLTVDTACATSTGGGNITPPPDNEPEPVDAAQLPASTTAGTTSHNNVPASPPKASEKIKSPLLGPTSPKHTVPLKKITSPLSSSSTNDKPPHPDTASTETNGTNKRRRSSEQTSTDPRPPKKLLPPPTGPRDSAGPLSHVYSSGAQQKNPRPSSDSRPAPPRAGIYGTRG